jgi:hypothetical protein
VRPCLRQLASSGAHVEVYVNPHERRGRRRCVVTVRTHAAGPPEKLQERYRKFRPFVFGRLWRLTWPFSVGLLRAFPEVAPWFVDSALRFIAPDTYQDHWDRVLLVGPASRIPAYSMEIAVGLDDAPKAIDEAFEVARRRASAGRVYSSAPISLRFVKASDAFMSMMHERDTVMIELIQVVGTDGGYELLSAYERKLYDHGGRPHWGQLNAITRVDELYPRFPEWLKVHEELNAEGVFDSPFAARVGIPRYQRPAVPAPMG